MWQLKVLGPHRTLYTLILRYDRDGKLDTTFGANGVVRFDSGLDDFASSVAIQANGKIVVAGSTGDLSGYDYETDYQILLLRYNSDGSPDGTFGENGVVIYDTGLSDIGVSLSLQPDGQLLVAGTLFDGVDYDSVVFRFEGDEVKQSSSDPISTGDGAEEEKQSPSDPILTNDGVEGTKGLQSDSIPNDGGDG